MNAQQLRKNTIDVLSLLVERYPNLPIGRIMAEASQNFDPYITTDVELARGLNQLIRHLHPVRGRGDQAMSTHKFLPGFAEWYAKKEVREWLARLAKKAK